MATPMKDYSQPITKDYSQPILKDYSIPAQKPVITPQNKMLGALETAIAGPSGMASREPGKVLSEASDVAFGGVPRNILRYPGTFSMSGVPGVETKEGASTANFFGGSMSGMNNAFGGKRRLPTSGAEEAIPSPEGFTGKVAGNILGAASMAGMSEIPGGGEPIKTSVSALEKYQPSIDLARGLESHAKGALDVSGENLHGALNATPQNVDLTKLQQTIDYLPPKVQFDIFKDPQIERIVDMLSPSIRNAELIRAHINNHLPYVDFNSKAPLQQAYVDVGKIMREAAPETQPFFEDYAKTKSAYDRVTGNLKTSEGQDNPSAMEAMFRDKNKVPDEQAFEQLAQNEPRIKDIQDQVKRFGQGVRTAKNLKRFGTWAGIVGGGTLIGERGVRGLSHLFGQ